MALLKKLAARLPDSWQTELKRVQCANQIARGSFLTDEPEYQLLHELVKPGDWVVDIGANVGHYTCRMSDLVGPHGRVIAFEPVPRTFALLAANVQRLAYPNVSLMNAAASDRLHVAGISMPKFSTGLSNYYQAQLSSATESALRVLAVPLDLLCISQDVALVKIDAEGHEARVLAGMEAVIAASHPNLIIETGSEEVVAHLTTMGYVPETLEDSPNVLFRPH